jgi:hypothetical protein
MWIVSWLDRLGTVTVIPDTPVTAVTEPSGTVARIRVDASVRLVEDRVLHVRVELDGSLRTRAYRFDLVVAGERRWGWHGHPEPVGFHHRHLPSGFTASPSGPATFEEIEELLHRRDFSG